MSLNLTFKILKCNLSSFENVKGVFHFCNYTIIQLFVIVIFFNIDINKNNIDAKESDLVRILSVVADCMNNYLEQNSSVEKIYDEMPLTLKVQKYEDLMQVSFDKWPGTS